MPINRITDADIDAFQNSMDEFEAYQQIATKSAIYPGRGTMLGLSYCAHKLAGEAGELNEHFGKAQRDDGLFELLNTGNTYDGVTAHTILIKPLDPARRDFILKEIGDCLWYLSALCNELGVSLFSVALMNLKKLKSRSDRDALQGSGDDR